MNYYHLKALVAATKSGIALSSPTQSFSVVADRPKPYIEPKFAKQQFEAERLSVYDRKSHR